MTAIALLGLALLQVANAATASIQGTVLQPGGQAATAIADAQVVLTGLEEPRIVKTDAGGRFAFTRLPPGSYRARVFKEGFVRQSYGGRDPDSPGTAIKLAAGQQVANIVIPLEPASTVSGWIADDDGAPIGNVVVQAFRTGFDARGNHIMIPAFTAQTDDRGQYRLYWIDPGEYMISATPTPRSSVAMATSRPYLTTYYPGSSEFAAAKPVAAHAGADESAINFRMSRGLVVSVSGAVTDRQTSQPVPAAVTLTARGIVRSGVQPQVKTKSNGIFEFKNVSPGSYTISATTLSGDGLAGFGRIEVGDGNLDDVKVAVGNGIQVSGQLYLESPATLDWQGIRIGLIPVDPEVPGAISRPPQDNGGFVVAGVQNGEYTVEVSGLPGDAYLKLARIRDTDALDAGVVVNGQPETLAVVLSPDGGHVNGTALDSAGQPAAQARIILAPDAARRRRPDQYRVVDADNKGNFMIRGIPPGDYTLFAWDAIPQSAYLSATFMSPYEDQGIPVHVISGANDDVNARVVAVKR